MQIRRLSKAVVLGTVLTLLVMDAAAAGTAAPVKEIVGEWRGVSECVDLANYPNCKNEQVIYDITATASQVTLKGDKVIDGKRLPMGDLVLVFEPGDHAWLGDFKNDRVHVVWKFKVSGGAMSGTLTDVVANRLVRRATLKRTP
jgi:hypothetical protein